MKTYFTIKRLSPALAALLVLLGSAVTASANTYSWNKTGANTYGTAANWSPATVPGSADTAVFNNSGVNGGTQSKIGSGKSVNTVQFVNTGTTLISANTTATQTWTIGAGGISIASGAGAVTISQSGLPIIVSLSGSQTWTNSTATAMTLGAGAATSVSAASASTLTLNGNFTFATPVANGAGTLTLVLSGGTVAMQSANTYTGSTTIGAGATLDVSSQTSYALGSGGLHANGTGTGSSTQATIKGGTTVDLGAYGIALAWGGNTSGTDTSHPCLVVSQGALTLNNNAFTINGSTLGTGTYTLISVTGGTINQNGSPSYAVSGTAIDGSKSNVISVSGGSVILTVSPAASITANPTTLASPLVTAAGTASPAQSVDVSGQTLTTDITATAQTNFEVSGDGVTFGTTATFPQSGGTAGGTLYVRLSAAAALGYSGEYNTQTIVTLSSTGASPVNVKTTASGNKVGLAPTGVTWPTAGALRLGLTLASSSLSGGTSDQTGTFAWTTPGYSPLAIGTQPFSVTFTPDDPTYGPLTHTVNVVVTGGNGTWILDGNDNWSVGGDWQGNAVADGAGATASFDNGVFSRNRNVTLDASRTLGALSYYEGSRSLHIVSGGGTTLTFDNSGSPALVTIPTESGSSFNGVYFDTPVLLNGSLHLSNQIANFTTAQINFTAVDGGSITNVSSNPVTITNLAGGIVNLAGPISDGLHGTVAVAQAGGGNGSYAMTLSGANTYSGGTTVSNGTLTFTGSGAQPSSGTLAVSGGAIVNLNGTVSGDTWPKAAVTGAGTLNQALSFGGFGVVSPAADMSGFSGIWNISGSGLVTVQSPFVSPASGATIKVGSGNTLYLGWYGTTVLACNVELYGADDGEGYGQLRVENGNQQNGPVILKANSTIGSTSGNGYISGAISDGGSGFGFSMVGGGTVVLSGNNTYTGATTVSQGTLGLVGGSQKSPITVSGGASLGFALGSPTTSTSTFNLSAGTIQITGTPTLASYSLIASSAGITGTPVLATPISGYALQVSGNALNLVQTGGSGFSSWITGTFANGTVPSGQQGPHDNPTHDGISNLLKYAIAGQDPTVANATIGSFNGTTLSFTKRAGTSGITYAIEQSTDLGTWAEVTGGSYTNNSTTISYTLTPGSPVKNFIRLQVLETP